MSTTDAMFNQLPTELDLKTDGLEEMLLPDLLRTIPLWLGECEADEISIERHLDEDDIEREADKSPAGWDSINQLLGIQQGRPISVFVQETIYAIKESSIRKDIARLAERVKERYLEQLKQMGFSPDNLPPDLHQVIEVPFTMIDLYPGDTQIHYRLYTKRELKVLNGR